MEEQMVEFLVEAAWLVLEGALVVALTVVGFLGERIGFTSVTGGETIGLWFVYMGTIALYVGLYMIGYRRLLPRIRRHVTGESATGS